MDTVSTTGNGQLSNLKNGSHSTTSPPQIPFGVNAIVLHNCLFIDGDDMVVSKHLVHLLYH